MGKLECVILLKIHLARETIKRCENRGRRRRGRGSSSSESELSMNPRVQRYLVAIEYIGTRFSGSQQQAKDRTVVGVLQVLLNFLHTLCWICELMHFSNQCRRLFVSLLDSLSRSYAQVELWELLISHTDQYWLYTFVFEELFHSDLNCLGSAKILIN